MFSVLAGFLAKHGLKVLSTAVKAGIGYGERGVKGAVEEVAESVGLDISSTEEQIIEALSRDPSLFARLKEIENAIPLALIEADKAKWQAELFTNREIRKYDTQDRSSARNMYMSMGGSHVPALAYIAVLAFFITAVGIVFFELPDKNEALLHLILGAIISRCDQVYNFVFGSSNGSKLHDEKEIRKEAVAPLQKQKEVLTEESDQIRGNKEDMTLPDFKLHL